MKSQKRNKQALSRADTLQLAFYLLAGLLLGSYFIFLLPPWQHYDEPKHFEYVWLAANLDHLPRPGDRSETLNRQVVSSMGVYRFSGQEEIIKFETEQKVEIPGYSQLEEPPLYYLAAAVPLKFLKNSNIEVQLIAARFVSLLFYLLTILSAWGIARLLTAKDHPLRWMLPLSLVFLPAFTDLMTAVNSDTAAVGVASLFLWAAVSLLRRGFSLFSFLGLIFNALLAFFTKNTAYFVLLLFPVVVLFTFLKNPWRMYITGLLIAGAFAAFVVSLLRDDPRDWLRATLQSEPIRVHSPKAVDGEYVFSIDAGAENAPEWWPPVLQSIPFEVARSLGGETLTLGFWAWADKPNTIQSPVFHTVDLAQSFQIAVEKNPQFYAFEIHVPENIDRAWIALDPQSFKEETNTYYDGLVLARGQRPHNLEPVLLTPGGTTGEWGDEPFENILRNPSAEKFSIRFRPRIDTIGARLLPDRSLPSLILASLVDIPGVKLVHLTAFDRLFRNFWGRFAWGHINLLDWGWLGGPYLWLAVFSSIGVLGAVIAVVRRFKRLDLAILLVFTISLAFCWGLTFLRGVPYLTQNKMYLSVARHAYPAIIPTMLFFAAGYYEIISLLDRLIRIGRQTGEQKTASNKPGKIMPGKIRTILLGAYLGCFVLLTLAAILSITRYYHWY